ncbi:MAG: Acyl-CoA dehydrogenase [Frankiales bacterium]|nr:Acyl-CoA dehydrogenase [Frankiales bacterium]
MNFDLSDEQRALASAARDFFSKAASPADSRAALEDGSPLAPGLKAVADTGFHAILQEGGTVLDLSVVATEAGRVLSAPSIAGFGRVSVLDPTADLTAGVSVVDAGPALDAATATVFYALRDGQLVRGAGTVTSGPPLDPTRGLADVTLTEVTPIDGADRWEHALRVGQVLLAAEDLGTAERAVEIGVQYAKDRKAFGRAIGSYQAVKHSLVNAFVGVEQLRSLAWWAAWAADENPAELPLAAAAVKGLAATVLEQATETLIQVHGGIGFTWEHDAHLYWRRAKVDRFLLGDDVEAYDTVARLSLV